SDLQVQLRAPDGDVIALLDHPQCEGANISATFDDLAPELGNDQCVPADISAITGPVKAIDELGPLLGGELGGTWTLEITDTEPEETGTLDQACVVLVVEGG